MTIKVLIVDDSAVVREVLTEMLSKAPDIEVIGACPDPIFAQQVMKTVWPDVMVLDIEMPRMDGLTFLRKIMAVRPTPVVICSSLTQAGAKITLDALSAGAVALITKPTVRLKAFLEESIETLLHEVRAAALARLGKLTIAHAPDGPHNQSVPTPMVGKELFHTTDRMIAIGTSTGGTQALEFLLPKLPHDTLGIAIVQHMPEQFTKSFAARLNGLCKVQVQEAQTGDRLLPGIVLIAPGGRHMSIRRNGAQFVAEVKSGPLVSRHCPSVDVLFRSVAQSAGRNAIGVILTGMGDDGARGMREMLDTGARTIAQDEGSCVVYGMPKEAVACGGVQEVMSLGQIAHTLIGMRG
jgi:two-component system chemotaxis response regulator CheB